MNNVNSALDVNNRKISESIRLIQNEEFSAASVIINAGRINLLRMESLLSVEAFEVLINCFRNLKSICDNQNTVTYNGYVAPRIKTNGVGRPKVDITKQQLEIMLAENFSAKQITNHFGCSVQLIYKRCYECGLKFRNMYFVGDQDLLISEISELHRNFPNSGVQMMTGYLKSRGLVVQRSKVRKILGAIDPVGTAVRWSSTVTRRTYRVPTPNSLWHMDDHLKLIRWRFAIHGCIDGSSRLIVYLKCTTSMTASSVAPFFASAVVQYGLPSRVRSDCGYENLFVAMIMNVIRGENRGSHIAGQSVHNQRIERLWVDVFKEIVDFFINEFWQLEEMGCLNTGDLKCMFALQKFYLPYINEKLDIFTNAWNNHKIRTERNKTPQQIWLSGMLNNIYSRHTASREVFNEEQDLYTRIISSFGLENSEIPINEPNEENISNLEVRLNLTEEQLVAVNHIIENDLDYRNKYIHLKNYLESIIL